MFPFVPQGHRSRTNQSSRSESRDQEAAERKVSKMLDLVFIQTLLSYIHLIQSTALLLNVWKRVLIYSFHGFILLSYHRVLATWWMSSRPTSILVTPTHSTWTSSTWMSSSPWTRWKGMRRTTPTHQNHHLHHPTHQSHHLHHPIPKMAPMEGRNDHPNARGVPLIPQFLL